MVGHLLTRQCFAEKGPAADRRIGAPFTMITLSPLHGQLHHSPHDSSGNLFESSLLTPFLILLTIFHLCRVRYTEPQGMGETQ